MTRMLAFSLARGWLLGALAETPKGTASPFRLAGSGLRWLCQGENRRRASARRNQFQNTKSTELIFSALLSEDGTRNVRFERVLRT
jgi:hypothetical protein